MNEAKPVEHEDKLMIVPRADVEAMIAVVREFTSNWQDGYMWEEFSEVHCRYCDAQAKEHPYKSFSLDGVTVEHTDDCVITRAEALLARMEGQDD